ncbi:MAG: hypothetical protein IIZ06_03715 [Kiritimatiellae bacterium]|nr:hypothetical protein [Kiritimatiellia bacterium]
MTSSDPVVANALAARNSAYSDFGIFKDYIAYVKAALSSVAAKIDEATEDMKRQAETSKRGSKKAMERDYIDECLKRCFSALKEARDRIQRQASNVMQ